MKYFVVSDIHSDYTGLKTALKSAGFNKNNKNHCMLQNVYFYDDVNLAARLIKDNILLNMKYK